jgi:hypothetical protein
MNSAAGKWLIELETSTQRARLLASSAYYVYEQLRDQALERARWRFCTPDETLERNLLARGQPLVDIALASFAASAPVVTQLWQRTAGDHYADPQVRKGIRLACLSNHTVMTDHFPASIIGSADLKAILAAPDREEANVLIGNDKIDEQLLVALYGRQDPFDGLEDAAWRDLVMQSSHNNQINGNQEDELGDELSQSAIHQAIFGLLEAAPATGPWVVGLHYFLESLDPQQVTQPPAGRVGAVLARWGHTEVLDKDGTVQSGVYPGLTYADEFRCLVGALYGGGGGGQEQPPVIHGSAASPAVAERCAYYGNAALTAAQVEACVRREPVVFAFAASCNLAVMARPELRRLLEEGASGRDFKDRYLTVLHHYQKRWPNDDYAPLAAWLRTEAADAGKQRAAPASAASVAELDKKLANLQAQITWLEKSTRLTFIGLIVLAILDVIHLVH